MRRSRSSASATVTSSTKRPPPRFRTETTMLLIDCPYCGARPEIEFSYGGQAHIARPQSPATARDEEWTNYLYIRANTRGVHAERWRHTRGCGRFFNALRDTTTDQFLAFYKTGEPPPALPRPGAASAAHERT